MVKIYKKSILAFVFILLIQIIATSADENESKNDCNYSDPTEKCECSKYLNSKNQCIEKCADGEFSFEYKKIDKFKFCASCKSQVQYTSSKKDGCVNTCAQGEIEDKENKVCLANEKECRGYVKENKCIKCQENEIIDRKNQKCLLESNQCEGYIKDSECIYCKEDEVIDLLQLQCLTDEESCLGILEGKYCKGCGDKIVDKKQNKCIADSECEGFVFESFFCLEKCEKPYFTFKDSNKCEMRCDEFIIDEEKSICSSKCDDGVVYQKLDQDDKVEQKYCKLQKCPEAYYQISIEGENQINCASKCKDTQIPDQKNRICLDKQQECKNFISSDEKECVEKCGENEILEVEDGIKYCRVCEEIIREETKGNIKLIECASQCPEGELIYEFGDKNQFNKCILASQCVNRKISLDNKYCSENCDKNELTFGNECVQKCPKNTFYSADKKSCLKECSKDQFIKSNGRQCLYNCNQVYEIPDKNSKNCLKCKENEQFTFENSLGVCKEANTSEQILLNIKGFLSNFKDKLAESDFEDQILKPVQLLTSQNENKISQITSKSEKDQKDISAIHETINQQKLLILEFLNFIKPEQFNKSLVLGQTNFKIIAQAQQPGQKFKTKFVSEDFGQNKTSTLLEEQDEQTHPSFNPSAMVLAYIKNNYFCQGAECKNTHPLLTLWYTESQSKRILAETNTQTKPQEFEMEYPINSSNKTNQLLCLSYDQKGTITRQPVAVKADKIMCKFNYSTSLFFDENCKYVDKKYCIQKDVEQDQKPQVEQPKDEQNTISLAKIFFVIGLIGILLIYCLRKDSRNQKTEQRSKTRIQYDDDEQIIHDVELSRRRYPKQI